MKELYAICGYTDTFDKSSHLINNLNTLKLNNKETLLVNHFPVDPIVYKDFDFYLYDKDNTLLTDDAYKFWTEYKYPNYQLFLRSVTDKWHAYAALRLFLYAIRFAQAYEYDILHLIEYDTLLKNLDELEDNKRLIQEGYNGVAYEAIYSRQSDWWFGNVEEKLFSIKTSAIPKFTLNAEQILKDLQEKNGTPEHVFYDYFVKDNNILIKKDPDFNSIEWGLEIEAVVSKNNTSFCVSSDNGFWIFSHPTYGSNKIEVIINDEHYSCFNLEPTSYIINRIFDWDKIKTAKIIFNNKVYRNYTFNSQEEKDKFYFYNDLRYTQ